MNRVEELKQFHQQGGFIPIHIYLADLKDEGLVCFDENHRRVTLQQLQLDQECFVDIMTSL
jgi:hypothetical protein